MAGLILSLLGIGAYLILLFVIHDFTYRTWLFDGIVGLGVLVAGLGWLDGGSGALTMVALLVALTWFVVSRRELTIRGSDRLRIQPGKALPRLELLTTDHRVVTDRDLIENAPTLLILYRGWWCPSHKAQLDEIVDAHEDLAAKGVSVYAASVDGPEESRPVQARVGDRITILCGLPEALLDEIGVKDERGAPWYDRLIFGAKQQVIAMPSAILIDENGIVVYAYRSTRVDERAAPKQILAKA